MNIPVKSHEQGEMLKCDCDEQRKSHLARPTQSIARGRTCSIQNLQRDTIRGAVDVPIGHVRHVLQTRVDLKRLTRQTQCLLNLTICELQLCETCQACG